jgi:peptidyl-dipeptidase A
MTFIFRTFWDKSIIEKPIDGRDIVCHASAWDFFSPNDVRIKQCTRITMDHLFTVHHELGHIQYFLQYQHLPVVYRDGANPGFHEAIGDAIALSITPKHLKKVGLLHEVEVDDKSRLNELYKMGLSKVMFLPSAFVFDKYRWQFFRGQINESQYNCKFWQLREQFCGVTPPVVRTEDDFDAPAKYHISANVEYLRYFVSFVIQFQFHKALCIKAGEYIPGHPEKTLDNCDIYQSLEAGSALK